MNPLQERLQSFLNYEDISVRAFERQCDIKAGTVGKMTEKSYGTTFHKIAQAYPKLNIAWLKTGEGEMLNPQPQKKIEVGVGIGEQSGGKSDFKFEVKEEPDSSTNKRDGDENCSLRQKIELLTALVAEKDARIKELKVSLDRVQKMNDYLMGQK